MNNDDFLETSEELTLEEMDIITRDIVDAINNNEFQPPRNRMDEIHSRIKEGTRAIYDSEKYKDYLRTLSKFHNYSINNTILIYSQMPYATRVAGITTWNNLGRKVNKGEHGIKIVSPIAKKVERKADDDEALLEEEKNTFTSFRISYVYDISQTTGKALPTIAPQELLGNVAYFQDLQRILTAISPVPVRFSEIPGAAKGYFTSKENEIVIQSGMSEVQTIKTMIHELAHSMLHADKSEKNSRTKEIEAESVAFTCCHYLGLDTSEYSFPYLVSWSSDKELPELKSSLETIKDTSSNIIKQIEEKVLDLNHIEIFQLDANSDKCFVGYDNLSDKNISQSDYTCVYVGPLNTHSPDDIFSKFNTMLPKNYEGRSLSVSDVIVMHQNSEDKVYYVDSFGFKELKNFKDARKETRSYENKKTKTRLA